MILCCPQCNTRYLVQPEQFGDAPRRVRCAKCGHEWREDPAAHAAPPLPSSPPPSPSPVAEAVAGAVATPIKLPALRGLKIDLRATLRWSGYIAGGLVTGVALLFLLAQDLVIEKIPASRGIYIMTGLYADQGREGLMLQQIRSEQRFDRGATVLYVTGTIENHGEDVRTVPDVVISALDDHGQEVAKFGARPNVVMLDPGGRTQFEGSFPFPEQAVTEIAVNFATAHEP